MQKIMLKATECSHYKRRDKDCVCGKRVASQEFSNVCQIPHPGCSCWKSTESERWFRAGKGPHEQVESELDSETWERFEWAEKRDRGIPGVNEAMSAGISTHEGEWLTLGACLKRHSGRISLLFFPFLWFKVLKACFLPPWEHWNARRKLLTGFSHHICPSTGIWAHRYSVHLWPKTNYPCSHLKPNIPFMHCVIKESSRNPPLLFNNISFPTGKFYWHANIQFIQLFKNLL